MRPGAPPMTNSFFPMVPQGQQGPRPSERRARVVPQGQQQVPRMQQQMLPRGRVYCYPAGHGMPDMSLPGFGGGMMTMPYDMGGMPLWDPAVPQQVPITALASALANTSPNQQRMMLGENLYPQVEQLEPEAAAKVIGMLLKMDQPKVLHLLESPEALKSKVAEAMEVLRSVAQLQVGNMADQLGSLSLNDSFVS